MNACEGLALIECLEEAVLLINAVIAGDYIPDSFTTQPWEIAILDAKEDE